MRRGPTPALRRFAPSLRSGLAVSWFLLAHPRLLALRRSQTHYPRAWPQALLSALAGAVLMLSIRRTRTSSGR